MSKLDDFKVEELEQRLEMAQWSAKVKGNRDGWTGEIGVVWGQPGNEGQPGMP